MKTDADWLRDACREAAASPDPITRNAAILVPATTATYIAVGVNRIPKGVGVTPGRLQRPGKYDYVEHAERAAIYAAAKMGSPTAGAVMYCPWFACCDCARGIIMAGIREVVGHVVPREATPQRWLNDIMRAEQMLTEAGVSLRWIAGRIGAQMLFDGRVIEL